MIRRISVVVVVALLALAGASDMTSASAQTGTRHLNAKAKPVTRRSLDSVLVPALRGNRAGRLRHGSLPHPGAGFTKLLVTGGAKPAFGNLTRDRVRDAAAVLLSTSGAGGSDQYVALYTNGTKRRLGYFDPATAAYAMDSGVSHAYVTKVRIKRRVVHLVFKTNKCGGFFSWRATLRWNGKRLVTRVVPVGNPKGSC